MKKEKLSVIVPTINSEDKIKDTVSKLESYLKNLELILDYEIIPVAQISGDKTFQIIKDISKYNKKIKPIFLTKKGKGRALSKGFKNAIYKNQIMIDDDLPYPLDFIKNSILIINKYDIIIGSRYITKSKNKNYLLRRIAGFFYRYLVMILFNIKQKDIQAGIKMIKKSSFKKMGYPNEKGYIWDTELLLKANRAGLKIKEYPVNTLKCQKNQLGLIKSSFQIFNYLFSFIAWFKIGFSKEGN